MLGWSEEERFLSILVLGTHPLLFSTTAKFAIQAVTTRAGATISPIHSLLSQCSICASYSKIGINEAALDHKPSARWLERIEEYELVILRFD